MSTSWKFIRFLPILVPPLIHLSEPCNKVGAWHWEINFMGDRLHSASRLGIFSQRSFTYITAQAIQWWITAAGSFARLSFSSATGSFKSTTPPREQVIFRWCLLKQGKFPCFSYTRWERKTLVKALSLPPSTHIRSYTHIYTHIAIHITQLLHEY